MLISISVEFYIFVDWTKGRGPHFCNVKEHAKAHSQAEHYIAIALSNYIGVL